MADLRNNEVAVNFEKNARTMGPSGRRKRSKDSAYLLVGGSSDIYDVTVNFEGKAGHWCEKEGGKYCFGNNGAGKNGKYGPPNQRDTRDPLQWCKHVKAALAATEQLAEAQEITAQAFGKTMPRKLEVVVHPPKPAFGAPAPATESPREVSLKRLLELEAEAKSLREAYIADDPTGLRAAIASLIETHGKEMVCREAKAS
jgi:hypothetical protein